VTDRVEIEAVHLAKQEIAGELIFAVSRMTGCARLGKNLHTVKVAEAILSAENGKLNGAAKISCHKACREKKLKKSE